MQDDWFDVFHNVLTVAYIFALIPWSFVSATEKTLGTEIGFRVYRLRQYEIGSISHGPKTSRIAWEAVTLGSDFVRKAAIVEWRYLIGKNVQETLYAGLGAVLITIPNNLSVISKEDKQAFLELEANLSTFDTEQAVYLIEDSEELKGVISHVVATGGKAPTAAEQLVNSVLSNNYFLTSNLNTIPPVVAAKQFNVIVSLTSGDSKSPTIVFSAHYDSAGLAPGYAVQADSNGSGVAALFELYAALRRFYSKGSRPRYNLVFALTAGGKYNYQGTRQFIENLSEKEDIELAICLDSLGNGEELYMQVAKDPKEDSIVTRVFNRVLNGLPKNRSIELVKKKINMAAEILSWEHEMFLMKKRQAVTFTHFKDYKDPMKESLLDTKANIDMNAFYWNVKAIASGIISFVYDLDDSVCADVISDGEECSFVGGNIVNQKRLSDFLDMVLSIPRHAENSENYAKLLKNIFERYSAKVILQPVKFVDAVVYGHVDDKVSAHVTKPAAFELVIGTCITAYLFIFYQITLNSEKFLDQILTRFAQGSYEAQ